MGCRVVALLVLNSFGDRTRSINITVAKAFNKATSLKTYWQHVASSIGEVPLGMDIPYPPRSQKISERPEEILPTPRQRVISLAKEKRQR